MRVASLSAAGVLLTLAVSSLASVISIPTKDLSVRRSEATTPDPTVIHDLIRRGPKGPKRPKYKNRPRPHPRRPRNRPKDCTDTNLVKNSDFDKSVKNWHYLAGSASQFFWVKDSKKRPAHSGSGQGYLFINRGYASGFLNTIIPAVEYGNTITVSAWLRYEAPADLSTCTIYFGDNWEVMIELALTPNWTKYSFETSGTGRPKEIEFRITCFGAPVPISVYIDDVSAKACTPRKPNPECQVLKGADNLLVNPGFECPDGITAWTGVSIWGGGTESLAQAGSKKGNPTHSGNGMGALSLDASQIPYTGIGIYQRAITGDITRKYVRASFWLSVDSKLNNVTGCLLTVATGTGYYVQEKDISNLKSSWTKFDVNEIEPTSYDSFEIDITSCSSNPSPVFYIDDVYFGLDKNSPPAPTVTDTPEPTPPPPGPCTSTPSLVDTSFENGDLSSWLLIDHTDDGAVMYSIDSDSTYAAAHAGSSAGVVYYPSAAGSVQMLQPLDGLCPSKLYQVSAWFLVPSGYDASQCSFSLGAFSVSEPVTPTAAGTWTRVDLIFLTDPDLSNQFPYLYVNIYCQHTSGEMVVLIDDISFSTPPACTKPPPSLSNKGGFEDGDTAFWNVGFSQGDETFAITSKKPRSGTKSAELTLPSTSNGVGFGLDFDACVGDSYTFRYWYNMPSIRNKPATSLRCSAWIYVYNTGEFINDEITVFDAWNEVKVGFQAGSAQGHLDFGISCLNQLTKVVVFVDDVAIGKTTG